MSTFASPRPALADISPWLPPAEDVRTLANGLQVRIQHVPGRRMAAATLVFGVGSFADPEGQAGLHDVTVTMLGEGAGDLDAPAFAAALQRQGATLDGRASSAVTMLQLSGLGTRLSQLWELVGLALREPRFDQADLDHQVLSRHEELIFRANDPQSLGSLVLDGVWFPEGHRLRLPNGGVPETLRAITVDDVRRCYTESLLASPATLFLAGDFSGTDLDADLAAGPGAGR